MTIRGVCHVEPLGGPNSKSDRQQVVIGHIPYNLAPGPAGQAYRRAVEEDRITEVSDVRDESGREAERHRARRLERPIRA